MRRFFTVLFIQLVAFLLSTSMPDMTRNEAALECNT